MPVPRWMANVNKRTFNKLELKRGKRPVLTHVGRKSGTVYRTPMDAHEVDGGFIFFVMYTSRSDWVRNVLDAGTARVRVDEREIDLVNPRLVSRDEAEAVLPPTTNIQPGRTKGIEYLQMDTAP